MQQTNYYNYNRGTRLLDASKGQKAVEYFKKQIRTGDNNFKELYLNLGNAYRLAGNDTLAVENYKKSNSPDIPFLNGTFVNGYDLAYNNLGLMCYRYEDNLAAIELYHKCLDINPLHFDAIWNYANAALREGFCGRECNWNASWQMYEYRFKRSSGPVRIDNLLPRWDELSRVKKICVLAEQGMGDKIMFGRYIHLLEEYCDEVWVQCPVELDVFFSKWNICRDSVECEGGYGFPICSLARRFWDTPVSENWLPTLMKEKKNGIGFVWSGSSTHANDSNRSVSPGYFRSLASLDTIYSLNPNTSCPSWISKSNCKDWTATIEFISGLDLVITVDTSIVHVCGSLGIECWMMQPVKETDFRWPLNSETTSWYSSVRVLQNSSWEKMASRVYSLLSKRKVDAPLISIYRALLDTDRCILVKELPMWATLEDYQNNVKDN